MKALILAGGFATRLRPLTDNLPKSLLPLGKGVVLDEQIKQLFLMPEIDAVYIVTNNKFHNLLENWREKSSFAKRIIILNNGVNEEKERLGAIGDLKYALDKIPSDDILVLGGDNLFSTTFKGILDFYKTFREYVIVAVNRVENSNMSRQPNEVVFDQSGRIAEFQEKPLQPKSSYFSSMLYLLPNSKLNLVSAYLSNVEHADNAGDFIAWLVRNKQAVLAYKMDGERFDIGDHKSYLSTCLSFKK